MDKKIKKHMNNLKEDVRKLDDIINYKEKSKQIRAVSTILYIAIFIVLIYIFLVSPKDNIVLMVGISIASFMTLLGIFMVYHLIK